MRADDEVGIGDERAGALGAERNARVPPSITTSIPSQGAAASTTTWAPRMHWMSPASLDPPTARSMQLTGQRFAAPPTGSGPLQAPFDGWQSASLVQACGVGPEQKPAHWDDATFAAPPQTKLAVVRQPALLVQIPAMSSELTLVPSGGPAPGPHQRLPIAQLGPGVTQTVPMPGTVTGSRLPTRQAAKLPPPPISSVPERPKTSGTGRAARWISILVPQSTGRPTGSWNSRRRIGARRWPIATSKTGSPPTSTAASCSPTPSPTPTPSPPPPSARFGSPGAPLARTAPSSRRGLLNGYDDAAERREFKTQHGPATGVAGAVRLRREPRRVTSSP